MTDLTPPTPGGCSERGVIRIGVVLRGFTRRATRGLALKAFQCSVCMAFLESYTIQWFSVHH